MKIFSAGEAKQNFGELMDTVQREPVSIEKHGRAVAVVISEAEYEEIKLLKIRSMVEESRDQIARGDFIEISDIDEFFMELEKEDKTTN